MPAVGRAYPGSSFSAFSISGDGRGEGIRGASSGGSNILVKSEKEEMIFSLTDRTKITVGKKELTFADLKNGSLVTVRYKKEGDKLVALRISVHMPKTTGMKEKAPSERAY